jgi:hypothetical protein
MAGGGNLDAYARQAGYPDYATMQAYMARQSAGYHQNNSRAVAPVSAAPAATVPTSQNSHPNTAQPQGVWDRILSMWPSQ